MSRLVAIQSNLAIPSRYEHDDPTCLINPSWERALKEEVEFAGPEAFRVPPEIRLRVCGQGEDSLDNELGERIRALGHGVTFCIERDDPETAVRLHALSQPETWGPPKKQYLGWLVIGSARIPGLEVEQANIFATGVPGHRTGLHPDLRSRVNLLGNPNLAVPQSS